MKKCEMIGLLKMPLLWKKYLSLEYPFAYNFPLGMSNHMKYARRTRKKKKNVKNLLAQDVS